MEASAAREFQRIAADGSPRLAVGLLMDDRAAWVRERLRRSAQLGSPFSGETITESLLLDMSEALPNQIVARAFTKGEEGRNGADWEWWFFDKPGTTAFGVRVQAKKLKLLATGDVGYDFAYRIGKKKKVRQVDALIDAANRDGLPAVYALYSGLALLHQEGPWLCCGQGVGVPDPGVGLVSARVARVLADLGSLKHDAVASNGRPWSCLMLCPTELSVRNEDLAGLPDEGSELAYWAADLVLSLEESLTKLAPEHAVLRAGTGVRPWSDVPVYVQAAVDSQGSELDGLPDDLAGIVTVSVGG